MRAVRAPRRTCAVSPPAPWHIGIPPSSAERVFPMPADRHTRDGVTRRAAGPKYSCARSLTATTAFPNVSGSCGTTSRTNAVPNADAGGRCTLGRLSEGDDRSGWAPASVAIRPPANRTSATTYERRWAATATPTNATSARINGQGEGGAEKTSGGSATSFTAVITSSTPTPSCNARMTGLTKTRATTSATWPIDSTSRNAASSRPAAWITSGDSSRAIATAVSAFSGWTGKGILNARPAPITSRPAQTKRAPAPSPLTRMSAAASGTKTPRSARAPVTSPSRVRGARSTRGAAALNRGARASRWSL